MAVSVPCDLGQTEARRQTPADTRKWTERRAKVAGALRSLFSYAVIVTIAVFTLTHREELQRIISQNIHRIMAPGSGSLRQNASSHENEVDQASQ